MEKEFINDIQNKKLWERIKTFKIRDEARMKRIYDYCLSQNPETPACQITAGMMSITKDPLRK